MRPSLAPKGRGCGRWLLAAALALLAPAVAAHGFGRLYTLPVPVWMYLYGAAAALLASFALIAWFAVGGAAAAGPERELTQAAPLRWARRLRLRALAQGLSLAALLLAIASALVGSRNPYANFAMTWFWVLLLLGLPYLCALLGNLEPTLNPWRGLAALLGRLWPASCAGRWAYPARLGHAPALLALLALAWVELHTQWGPRGLGLLLLAYSGWTLLGVVAFGAPAWFARGDLLAVWMRLLGALAPLGFARPGQVWLRAPGAGLLQLRVAEPALLLFVLLLLAATALDGLRATAPWAQWFWVDLYQWLEPWVGKDPVAAYHRMQPLYLLFSSAALLLAPALYLAIYLLAVALAGRLGGGSQGTAALALRFAPSLLPIALVYHMAHYYPLLLAQGPKILGLLSDPFGWRWDLFGSRELLRGGWTVAADSIWHTQLALIVGGHIVGVYIAHLEAFRLFPGRRRAALSQLPMLALMMAYTAFGLWILAQPLAG